MSLYPLSIRPAVRADDVGVRRSQLWLHVAQSRDALACLVWATHKYIMRFVPIFWLSFFPSPSNKSTHTRPQNPTKAIVTLYNPKTSIGTLDTMKIYVFCLASTLLLLSFASSAPTEVAASDLSL
jgi:hypothetical protein